MKSFFKALAGMTLGLTTLTAPSLGSAQVLFDLDEAQWDNYQSISFNIVSGFQPDAFGMVGENKENRRNYNPTDQYGVGSFLRFAALTSDRSATSGALNAIGITLAGKLGEPDEPQGLPHIQRVEPWQAKRLPALESSFQDARILADFCTGLNVADDKGLITSDFAGKNAPRIEGLLQSVLDQGTKHLVANQDRPDRLLTIAVALYSCGQLVRSSDAVVAAGYFAQQASKNRLEDGRFGFGGRYDIGMQLTATRYALELLALGYKKRSADELVKIARASLDQTLDTIEKDGKLNPGSSFSTCNSSFNPSRDNNGWVVQDAMLSLVQGGYYYNNGQYLGGAERLWRALGLSRTSRQVCFTF